LRSYPMDSIFASLLVALVLAAIAGDRILAGERDQKAGANQTMITVSDHRPDSRQIVAAKLVIPLDQEGLPQAEAWEAAQPVTFCADWQGKNADPLRQTEVRVLWSQSFLFIRFRASYREIYVYPGGKSRRDQLWLRDVAEVFIRPGTDEPRHYKEFEISPNGDWLDLDINSGRKSDLQCELKSRVVTDAKSGIWIAEMAIPVRCLAREFDTGEVWRLNFFRVEGPEPNRFYSSWQPTNTPQPNFHVPAVFGKLRFSEK